MPLPQPVLLSPSTLSPGSPSAEASLTPCWCPGFIALQRWCCSWGSQNSLPLQAAAVPLTWTAVWHVVGTHYLDIWGLAALTSSCCCDLPISAKVSGLPSLVGGSAEKVVRWALGSPGGCGEGV